MAYVAFFAHLRLGAPAASLIFCLALIKSIVFVPRAQSMQNKKIMGRVMWGRPTYEMCPKSTFLYGSDLIEF